VTNKEQSKMIIRGWFLTHLVKGFSCKNVTRLADKFYQFLTANFINFGFISQEGNQEIICWLDNNLPKDTFKNIDQALYILLECLSIEVEDGTHLLTYSDDGCVCGCELDGICKCELYNINLGE